MQIDEILGLKCTTHKEPIIEYCEERSCQNKFICKKCKEVDKCHSFVHKNNIISSQQLIESYYMQHKMSQDLLKHHIQDLPKHLEIGIQQQQQHLNMVQQHFHIQKQQVEQLTNKVLAQFQQQLLATKQAILSHLDHMQQQLLYNIVDFNNKVQQLPNYINKSYDDILHFQKQKIVSKEDKQKLNYLKDNYDWLKESSQQDIKDFSQEYILHRDKVDKLVKKTSSCLALVDSKRLLEQAQQILEKHFFKGWQQQVKGYLLKEEDNLHLQQLIQQLHSMHLMAEDIQAIRLHPTNKRYSLNTFAIDRINTIKQKHTIYNLVHHNHHLISLSADHHLKVFDFVSKEQGKLLLDNKGMGLTVPFSSQREVCVGDNGGFLQVIDYIKFKAHQQQITKILSYKYRDGDLFTDILLTTSLDKTVKIWDLYEMKKGKNEQSLMVENSYQTFVKDMLMKDDWLVVVINGILMLSKLIETQQKQQKKLSQMGQIVEESELQVLTGDDQWLVAGDKTGGIYVYQWATGGLEKIRKVVVENKAQLFCWVDHLQIDQNLLFVVTITPKGSVVLVYDFNTNQTRYDVCPINQHRYQKLLLIKHNQSCLHNANLITAGNDMTITYWKY